MSHSRFPTFAALGLAALLTATGAAWADAPNAGPGAHGRFQERLGLSDAQMAAIKEIHARHSEERKQLWQSLRQARTDLKLAALNGGDVKAKSAVVAALLSQMTELRATTLAEIAPILTPEQRDALAKMGDRSHWHHGHRATQG
jgi:Spy/CpxP family protein refolding chaperone